MIAPMKLTVPLPSPDLVQAACKELEGDIGELALAELFGQYPRNDNRAHVLLKVVTLNRLYSTSVYAVHDAANHICSRAEEVDAALTAGSPEIVDTLAALTLSASGKRRNIYSFASKYCSWHRPDKYPIWDSRVRQYLTALRWQLRDTDDAGLLGTNPYLWNRYAEFLALVIALQRRFDLDAFSFKEIDQFMWKYGVDPKYEDSASAVRAV